MRHSTSQHGAYQDRSTVKMNNLGFNWTSVTVDKMCLCMRQCSKQYSVGFFPGLARNFANDKKPISCVPESKQFWKKSQRFLSLQSCISHVMEDCVCTYVLYKHICTYIYTWIHIYLCAIPYPCKYQKESTSWCQKPVVQQGIALLI